MSKSFSDLGINLSLQHSLSELKLSVPTDIQQKAIPIILGQTEDVVAIAKTGTGKTAAFGVPLLQLIDVNEPSVQALIVAPTRELGHQIHANLVSYASKSPDSNYSCNSRSSFRFGFKRRSESKKPSIFSFG